MRKSYDIVIVLSEIAVKTRTNEFIPHHETQQIHNQVMQQQKHLEMEKDMGGYGM